MQQSLSLGHRGIPLVMLSEILLPLYTALPLGYQLDHKFFQC